MNYSINIELQKALNKLKLSNEEQRQQILKDIEGVEKYDFNEMKNFNPNSKREIDNNPATYGITGPNADKRLKIIKALYQNVDPKVLLTGSKELLDAFSDYNSIIRDREAEGDSVFNALFNNSITSFSTLC